MADESNKDKYVLFGKSNLVFSQWHPSTFTLDGITYTSAEQYMMYQKAILFKDKKIAKEVMETDRPDVQKALGRKVNKFDKTKWEKHCFEIVKKGNIAKFSQNEDLKRKLLDTYPKILAEASPIDKIWGIGLGEENPLAWDEKTWEGRNLLGYAIVEARKEIMSME